MVQRSLCRLVEDNDRIAGVIRGSDMNNIAIVMRAPPPGAGVGSTIITSGLDIAGRLAVFDDALLAQSAIGELAGRYGERG